MTALTLGTAFVTVLAACSPSNSQAPSEETTTIDLSAPGADWPQTSGSDGQQAWLDLVEDLAKQHHIKDPPQVSLVRYVEPSAWGKTQVECISAAGFQVRESQGGVVLEGDVPQEQGGALNLAFYTCGAQYPADPRVNETLPRVRAEMQYQYLVDTVMPCVTGLGYEIDDPPSLEVWLDRYYAKELTWDPFAIVAEQTPQDLDALYLACPHDAPDLYP